MKFLFSGLLICSLLTGCATKYQTQGLSGGYSSSQLNENVFRITFKGNGFTDRERTTDFVFLRSAEVALENGYSYFTIVGSTRRLNSSYIATPVQTTTNINSNVYGSSVNTVATTTTFGGDYYKISSPTATNTIACFKDKPKDFSYNARIIVKSIKEKYGIIYQ